MKNSSKDKRGKGRSLEEIIISIEEFKKNWELLIKITCRIVNKDPWDLGMPIFSPEQINPKAEDIFQKLREWIKQNYLKIQPYISRYGGSLYRVDPLKGVGISNYDPFFNIFN